MSNLPERFAAVHHCSKETTGIDIADFRLCGICLFHSGICRMTLPARHPSNTAHVLNERNSSCSINNAFQQRDLYACTACSSLLPTHDSQEHSFVCSCAVPIRLLVGHSVGRECPQSLLFFLQLLQVLSGLPA